MVADSPGAGETVSLFTPITLRGVTLRNRIGVSPMCQYSCGVDGKATDWHLVHLGARAVGGAGLVFAEATAVTPEGRISGHDLGLWDADQVEPLRRVTEFIESQGAVAGVQLAHAGRKASRSAAWLGGGFIGHDAGGWPILGPSALAYDRTGTAIPMEMTVAQIDTVVAAFAGAAARAVAAGFRVLEIHAAHGYLLHSFLSPVSNTRTDKYGGTFENRIRLLVEVVRSVRRTWGDRPLSVRLSVTEAFSDPRGWQLEDSVTLTRVLIDEGVDLIDCSSGGLLPGRGIFEDTPGYQVRLAATLRENGIPTAVVGGITSPEQADTIVRTGQADLVLLGRESLRDPSWPAHAARRLSVAHPHPNQYIRAYAGSAGRQEK